MADIDMSPREYSKDSDALSTCSTLMTLSEPPSTQSHTTNSMGRPAVYTFFDSSNMPSQYHVLNSQSESAGGQDTAFASEGDPSLVADPDPPSYAGDQAATVFVPSSEQSRGTRYRLRCAAGSTGRTILRAAEALAEAPWPKTYI